MDERDAHGSHDAHDERNKYERNNIGFTVLESMVEYINKVANSKKKSNH
jgi:hypothetical protein